ncbi:MAG: RHS repeat protein [Oscillospiraceae bacterium]|nr:RHS repeat protein [Oscillospiraceae bacterium]
MRKRIISLLMIFSTFSTMIPVFADNEETAENIPEISWKEEIQEEAPTPIPQNDVYYSVEEGQEIPDLEPNIHTETIPDDLVFPEDEYNMIGTRLPRADEPQTFTSLTEIDISWDNLFANQFGDTYLRPYAKKQDGQTISGNTNRLTIEETDLSLAGKNGLDVVIKRKHDNQDYNESYAPVRNSGKDNTYQRKYMYAFTNTRTNESVYIAFYTEDEFYIYMYNGAYIRNLDKNYLKTTTKDSTKYSFYDFVYVSNQITTDTSYAYYVYNADIPPISFLDNTLYDNMYTIQSWRTLSRKSYIGDNWSLVMPEVYLYRYMSERDGSGTTTDYYGDYIGAFRDIDGNIFNIDGYDQYTIYKTNPNRYTSSFECKSNYHLSLTKMFSSETLDDGTKYNFTIKDSRGLTYYFFYPVTKEEGNINKRQFFNIVAVEDQYGNMIRYKYDSSLEKVTRIIDTYGREINIDYTESQTTISYYDDVEQKTNKIIYTFSTLPSSALDNDSPIKPKEVKRLTVTNQLGEKTIYDARETQVMYAYQQPSSDINGYPDVSYEHADVAKNSNIERIIYPTGAETRYNYRRIYKHDSYNRILNGVYAVSASYDIVDGKEVNKNEYTFTNDGNKIKIIKTSDAAQQKTVSQYNEKGLKTNEEITPISKSEPYLKTKYTYSGNKPSTVEVNNNGLKNITEYSYSSYYPDLLFSITTDDSKIIYTYHDVTIINDGNSSIYTSDKLKTATYQYKSGSKYVTDYVVSTELTSDEKAIEYERVTQNDVIKSQIKYEYDREGNVTAQKQWTGDTNADGALDEKDAFNTVSNAYTNTTQKIKNVTSSATNIINADGINEGSITNTYKLNIYGSPTYKKDSYGTETTVEYDTLNRPVKYNLPNGGTQTVEYNSAESYTIVTDAAGIKYKNMYDGLGRIKNKYRSDGTKWMLLEEYTYDNAGRLASKRFGQSGASTVTESYTYDALDRLSTRKVYENMYTLLYTENYTYGNGYMTVKTTAADGTETADVRTDFDQYGRTTKTQAISGDTTLTTTYEYDYQNRKTKETDPNGNITLYEYNYDGQISKQTDAAGNSVTAQYDLAGQCISSTDAKGNTTVTEYDNIGRAVMTTSPFSDSANSIVKTYYDKNSNVIKTSVRKDENTYLNEEYKYDNMGNLIAAISGDSANKSVTQYMYDTGNRMTKMITGLTSYSANPSGGNVTTYTYGKDGYLYRLTDPMGEKEEYYCDNYGNVTQIYDKRGDVLNRTYGAYGVKYEGSPTNGYKTFTYNSIGQQMKAIDQYRDRAAAEESYEYDAFGRMISSTSSDGTVQTYTYDDNSNVLSYGMIKDGTTKNSITYQYDELNRLTKLTNGSNILSYSYDANGNLFAVIDSAKSNLDLHIMYNKANLPVVYRSHYGGTSYSYTMSYYLNGQKYQENDKYNNTSKVYAYNALGQLTTENASREDETTANISYTYDASGNRTRMSAYNTQTGKTDITDYTYDANNRMTSLTNTISGGITDMTRYYYDEAGNTVAEQKKLYTTGNEASDMALSGRTGSGTLKLYTYDVFNRLIKYNDAGTEAAYSYNANNLRASKTVDGEKTDFVWNGQNLAGEMTNGITTAYTYDVTGIAFAHKDNDDTVRYVKDPHGNVVEALKNGKTVGEYDYTAFGTQLKNSSTISNPFRYCGEYYDSSSGLIYLRNRYYDPSIGRFISEDPIKAGLNWYVYANNNPVMYVDPLGEDAIIITNKNSVGVEGVATAGHTSAIYQDANGEWYYTYWGDKAAAVIHIPNTYIKEYQRGGDVTANSMDSLGNFNNVLNRILSAHGFENITSNYTDATYIVGDFTASLETAYNNVNVAAKSESGSKKALDDGSVVFQGKNSAYDLFLVNCFDMTYASLSKGTLANGMNAGTYMKNLGFNGGWVPNNAIPKFSEVFMNSSFTYAGAYSSLLNYATLYKQGSPWAQKWSKANYANAVVGW